MTSDPINTLKVCFSISNQCSFNCRLIYHHVYCPKQQISHLSFQVRTMKSFPVAQERICVLCSLEVSDTHKYYHLCFSLMLSLHVDQSGWSVHCPTKTSSWVSTFACNSYSHQFCLPAKFYFYLDLMHHPVLIQILILMSL